MSSFACPVVPLRIENHPNADRLDIARVGDFQTIVLRGRHADGELGVYLPEAAELPEWILRDLGLWNEEKSKGELHGALGNRVKAIKLRGVLSQGLVLGLTQDGAGRARLDVKGERPETVAVAEGEDVAERLGITKYEPPVPAALAGRVLGANIDITHPYDFDNIKATPRLFEEGEEIVLTEKIHGTFLEIVCVPSAQANAQFFEGRVALTSKGLARRGVLLDHADPESLHAQAAVKQNVLRKWLEAAGVRADEIGRPIVLFGEVFGDGVQDLKYGGGLQFRAFDVAEGVREHARFLPFDAFTTLCASHGIAATPALYRGPFDRAAIAKHTDGKETVSGASKHLREGVVVKSATEAQHTHYGRKIAKSVSEAYLLRKDATEFQ